MIEWMNEWMMTMAKIMNQIIAQKKEMNEWMTAMAKVPRKQRDR